MVFATLNDRMGAGGIVRDHAADGGPVGGGDIRRELQAMRLDMVIEFIQHAARLDPDPAFISVDFQNAIEVFGKIENDAGADRLACLRSSAPPRGDRHAKLSADLRYRPHVVRSFRYDDTERHDLVDAGIGRIQGTVEPVKTDFARDGGRQPQLA